MPSIRCCYKGCYATAIVYDETQPGFWYCPEHVQFKPGRISDQILPCPACNDDDNEEGAIYGHSFSEARLECDCGCCGPWCLTLDEARAEWNKVAYFKIEREALVDSYSTAVDEIKSLKNALEATGNAMNVLGIKELEAKVEQLRLVLSDLRDDADTCKDLEGTIGLIVDRVTEALDDA